MDARNTGRRIAQLRGFGQRSAATLLHPFHENVDFVSAAATRSNWLPFARHFSRLCTLCLFSARETTTRRRWRTRAPSSPTQRGALQTSCCSASDEIQFAWREYGRRRYNLLSLRLIHLNILYFRTHNRPAYNALRGPRAFLARGRDRGRAVSCALSLLGPRPQPVTGRNRPPSWISAHGCTCPPHYVRPGRAESWSI